MDSSVTPIDPARSPCHITAVNRANHGPTNHQPEPIMPDINQDTPRVEATIAGETFQVATPFKAGDVLQANEASALNQTFVENIRNNMAKQVKDAKEAGTFDSTAMQTVIDQYVDGYEFGVRTGGGGRTSDPVMAEAMDIARGKVREALQKAGHKLADVPASRISELAKEAVDKNPKIMDLARSRVEAAREIGGVELGDFDSSSSEEAPKKGKKAAA